MLAPKAVASASKPKWVPASITEENVAAFVQAVTEARKANESVVEFNGKKYGIKSIKEDASAEDQGLAKKIQDVGTENAPKQPSDEVPAEVKEEDSEEIKGDNHDEKEADADEMPKLDDPKVEEELSGNQHKLDVNKNGKIDGDDLKKLRGEEKEEDSEEDDMGDESDDGAEGEDEKEEEKPKMTGEQVMASLATAYVKMNEGAPADAEAGPEVMDPATQKMKDDADDETEVVDLLPTAAQDGADKLDSAEKPAPANKSEALPKVAIVDAPVTTNESTVAMNESANTSSLWNLHGRHADSSSGGYMTDDEHARSKKKAIETHVEKKHGAEHKTDMMAHSKLHNSVNYSDMNPSRKSVDTKLSKMTALRNKHGVSHHGFPKDSHDMNHWHSFKGE